MNPDLNPTDNDRDRLELLDRLADRIPDLKLDQRSVEWGEMPDGAAALIVDGGGMDGGNGAFFVNGGEDVHAIGTLPDWGAVGCVVIAADGTRTLARVEPDPLGQPPD